MSVQIFLKFGRAGPVFNTPVFKAPFVHVAVALVVDVPQQAVLNDKICREVVDIQPCRFRKQSHFSHLRKVSVNPFSPFHPVKYGVAVDILLDDPFVFDINFEHFGNSDPRFFQLLIVIALGFDFVAEGIVIARLVVDLLDNPPEHHCAAPSTNIRPCPCRAA